jgi:hypothetical protein
LELPVVDVGNLKNVRAGRGLPLFACRQFYGISDTNEIIRYLNERGWTTDGHQWISPDGVGLEHLWDALCCQKVQYEGERLPPGFRLAAQ